MARENLDTTLLTQDTIIDVPLIELRSVSKKFQLESGSELKVLVGPSEVKERVKKTIDLVGLEGFEEAYPRELSGGMKQRVGVARALVMERPVLFLDEPFSALDVLTADTLRTEIIKIFQSGQTPARSLLIVTHNIREAVVMAKRILVMGVNPGHVRDEILNDLSYPRDEDSVPFGPIEGTLSRRRTRSPLIRTRNPFVSPC